MLNIYSAKEFHELYYHELIKNEPIQQLIIANLNQALTQDIDILFAVMEESSHRYFVCHHPKYAIIVTDFVGNILDEEIEYKVGQELANYLASIKRKVKGINAPAYITEGFVSYQESLNYPMHLDVGMNVMMLTMVQEVRESGILMLARENELDELARMYVEFTLEALGSSPSLIDAKEHLQGWIQNKILYVLKVNDKIVAMCSTPRKLSKGISVSAVYTKVDERGRGYCKSMMAQLCRVLLEENAYVTLYVDQKNPHSNAAYEKVGFHVVGSSVSYVFDEVD